MKILVTGAGGFLGPRIVESLLLQGCDDLRLQYRQQPKAGALDALRSKFPQARLEPVLANFLTRNALEPLVEDIECVIHAAAGTKGAAADMFLNTVIATRNLLEACRSAGVSRFVLVSSFAVYNTEKLPIHATLTEQVHTEETGALKGAYGFAKTQQEILVRNFQWPAGVVPILIRPGVIYGPGGGAFSARVGITALGRFVRLGSRGALPLTYVENCADAIVAATLHAPPGGIYNIVDDDLPSCAAFLAQYRSTVQKLKVVRLPYPLFLAGSRWLASYNERSKGQLPDLFSPYVVRSMYRPLTYSNVALKAIGWTQRVPTSEALARHFEALKLAKASG